MGFDTECDVVIESTGDGDAISRKIFALRNALLAEHLGREPSEIEREIEKHGSLIKTIEALNRTDGRGLVEVRMRELTADEEILAESSIADPERPTGSRGGCPVTYVAAATHMHKTFIEQSTMT